MEEHTTHSSLLSLGPQVRGVLESFLQETASAFPGGIACFAATGSCVTGDYVQGRSDINSVLVLTDMDPSVLDKLASMGRRYGKKRLRAPLLMTPEYIERSLDVFPIEFLDIKLIHQTLLGEDLFTDLPISKSMLRLQCERDLKAKLIHLHQGYISCSGGGRGLRALLVEAYPGFFPLFRAMLTVAQISTGPPILKDAVLSGMESTFAVGLEPFREIRAMAGKRGFGHDWSVAKDVFNKVYKVTHELSLIMDRIS
ncbi:MAG TPA: hypothetical protein PKM41_10445 [Deltaproteobacteria bacterium]|nr:hypothetical protein [Deltaproteobacteria bacterium]HOI06356.1 hypothetical protein [Deltaproteobacteria bacterium]